MVEKKSAFCTRLICLVLLIILITMSSTACGKKDDKNPETASNSISTESSEETEYIIEAKDYGGAEFKILSATISQEGGRHFSEFEGNIDSDKLSYAIYLRDNEIMNKYNISIKITTTTDWNTQFSASQMSDDLMFHVATPGISNAVYSIAQGSIACLDKYPMFDFSRPWWQTDAIEHMKVAGGHYFALGDINLLAYDSVGVMFYNKQLANENKFTDITEHVKNNTWDYETMLGYVAKVTSDFNGNDEYGVGDIFGLYGGSYSALCFTYAGNFNFVEKDADGVPKLKENMSDFITFFQKLVNDHHNTALIGYGFKDDNMFKENRLLFSINMLGTSADLRAVGTDYGILPLPKWNAAQDHYYTFPHQSASTTICIPVSNREYDMTSRIIENMVYLSHKDVLHYYIEENLFLKSLDGDEDSYDAVKTVLEHLNCDIFFSYRAGITQFLRDSLDNNDPNIASKLKKYEKSIDEKLSGIVAGVLES